MWPERYLYANSPKRAKAYSNAYKLRMRPRFPLTSKFTKRSPTRMNKPDLESDEKVRIMKSKIQITHSMKQWSSQWAIRTCGHLPRVHRLGNLPQK